MNNPSKTIRTNLSTKYMLQIKNENKSKADRKRKKKKKWAFKTMTVKNVIINKCHLSGKLIPIKINDTYTFM